jgi:hypothetical protein
MNVIRAMKYRQTLDGIQATHVTIAIPKGVIAERLQKAVAEAREGFHARMLAALDAGTIAEESVMALCTPDEIRDIVAARRQHLRDEMDRLDAMARRLVPRAKREMLISGDRTLVDDAEETGSWFDLGDPSARETGGDARTKAAQRSTDRVRKSIAAMKAAADELN